MAITIDWANAIINVPRADMLLVQSVPTEIRDLDLNAFRAELKALESSLEGMGFQKILDHYTAVQVGGIELAHVLIILAPYTVTFEDGQYAVNLIGANSNVGDRVNVNQVSVRSANSAGLAQTKDIEYASFDNAVHIDEILGNDTWKGNAQYPVQTAGRAVEVVNYRGIKAVHIHTSMSFGADAQFPGCYIAGESKLLTALNVEAGANVDHCTFENLTISGALDQSAMLQRCVVDNLSYVEGDIHDCEVTGVLTVAGSQGLEIFNSYSGRKGPIDPAVIDMDGPNTGAKNVAIHNWSGHIRVRNMTAGYLGISCSGGGHIRVESTCTGGMIHVMGNFKLINQAAGSTVLTTYMTNPASIAEAVRSLSTTTPASPDTVGEQWERAATFDQELISDQIAQLIGLSVRSIFNPTDASVAWNGTPANDWEVRVYCWPGRTWTAGILDPQNSPNLTLVATVNAGGTTIHGIGDGLLYVEKGQTDIDCTLTITDESGTFSVNMESTAGEGMWMRDGSVFRWGSWAWIPLGGINNGGGGGDASWSQEVPNGFTEGQAGWVLDNVNSIVASFQKSLETLLARTHQAGIVSVPYATETGETLVFFTNTDYDDISFSLGPQWRTYLEEPTAEVWFTVKQNPRRSAIIDVEAEIKDTISGLVELDLTGANLNIEPGTYFWQIQIRQTTLALEKRVVQEGTVYVKPTFKT
jgi:hypothetical protein